MTDEFDLEIDYKGELKEFPAQLLLQGYTHRFKVVVDGVEIFFEPDEEGGYRAVRMSGQDEKQLEKIDRSLLQAMQEKIRAILAWYSINGPLQTQRLLVTFSTTLSWFKEKRLIGAKTGVCDSSLHSITILI